MSRKKICLILILSIICSTFLFAGADHEYTTTVTADSLAKDSLENLDTTTTMMNFIANEFNIITLSAITNLTPFPSAFEDATGQHLPMSAREVNVRNMVAMIFIGCIVAEILFMTIKGYLTDDGSTLKMVGVTIVKGAMLFWLTYYIPTLIELVRTGFQQAAIVISGQYDNPLLSSMSSITQLPGIIIQGSSDVIAAMDPSSVGVYGNLYEIADPNMIMGALYKLVYMLCKIVACICLCIAAIHVMFNIIEVYLLIGMVMVLTPFATFGLTRFLGEKAVMSLFANVMELFVIMVIVFSCMTLISNMQSDLMDSLASITNINFEYSMGTSSYSNVDINEDYQAYASAASALGLSPVSQEQMFTNGKAGRFSDKAKEAMDDLVAKYAADKIGDGTISLTPLDYTIIKQKLNSEGNTSDDTYYSPEVLQEAVESFVSNNDIYNAVSGPTQYKIFTNLLTDYPDLGQKSVATATGTNVNARTGWLSGIYTVSATDSDNAEQLLPMHLVLTLLCVIIQFYFIGQSGRIANALMSGTIATDGFGGAMMKMAAGKAVGMAMGMPAKGLKALGATGKTAMKTANSISESRGNNNLFGSNALGRAVRSLSGLDNSKLGIGDNHSTRASKQAIKQYQADRSKQKSDDKAMKDFKKTVKLASKQQKDYEKQNK